MHSKRTFTLPKYTEYAFGYPEETLWLGLYRTSQGEFLWDDGRQQGTIPLALLKVFEGLWGKLVPGYAYLLDIEQRQVQVMTMMALKAVLPDMVAHSVPQAPTWLQEETEVRALVDALVSYTESPETFVQWDACAECTNGYVWVTGLQEFLPCAWCNDTFI
jgi:hypothetical protein